MIYYDIILYIHHMIFEDKARISTEVTPKRIQGHRWRARSSDRFGRCTMRRSRGMRGLRNTVEIALFEISNSMKPYPSVCHAYASKLRSVKGLFETKQLDEVSDRIPPTSQGRRQALASPPALSLASNRGEGRPRPTVKRAGGASREGASAQSQYAQPSYQDYPY